MANSKRSSRNRTITLAREDEALLSGQLYSIEDEISENSVILGDCLQVLKKIPDGFVDLLVVDPPYNLNKVYSSKSFRKMDPSRYQDWLENWISLTPRVLKKNASIYICCDWSCSPMIYNVASKYFRVINRITWEREKGRGAARNWKNCSEDIWYFSNGNDPKFNLDSVKLKKRVIAPYRDGGAPKDWYETDHGRFRFTSPSNLWTDLTVPFWSMPENTEHPTQKPEKLIARLVLASSNEGDMVLDPFLGSGTTAVVSKKLNRKFVGIEAELEYCLISQKRINMVSQSARIQGYEDGVFLERNSVQLRSSRKGRSEPLDAEGMLL